MSFFFFSPFFTAAAFGASLVPLSVRLALPLGALDLPDGKRKRHAKVTPRLGGLGLYFAVLLALLPFLFSPSAKMVAAVLAGGAIVTALGVSDDIFSLSPLLKLLAELFAALLPFFFDLAPKALTVGALSLSLPPVLRLFFSLLWVLTLTNAFNMIDGLNGLAASQIILSALTLSLFFGYEAPLALGGAAFGFLPYNVKRARSFLGDGGALFFGYALSVFSLGVQATGVSVFTPLLFFVPLCDLVLVSVFRLSHGKSPFAADDSHLHHRLCKRGFSRACVVLLLFLLALGALAAFLLLSSPLPLSLSLACLLLLGLPLLFLVL